VLGDVRGARAREPLGFVVRSHVEAHVRLERAAVGEQVGQAEALGHLRGAAHAGQRFVVGRLEVERVRARVEEPRAALVVPRGAIGAQPAGGELEPGGRGLAIAGARVHRRRVEEPVPRRGAIAAAP
jgi:hypothetical protein